MKAIDNNAKEINPGFYSFRAKGITPSGEIEVMYSRTYEVQEISSLWNAQKDYITFMENRGYTDMKILAIFHHDNARMWTSNFSMPIIPIDDDTVKWDKELEEEINRIEKEYSNNIRSFNNIFINNKEDLSLTDLNKEFILDI